MNTLTQETPLSGFQRFVTSRFGDKVMATFLVAWMTYSGVVAIQKGMGLTLTLLFAAVIGLNILVLFRRTPQKVTPNPWFWLLTVTASLHFALYGLFLEQGAPSLTPQWVYHSMAISGMLLMIWARASMGLNFGFVPALRNIVTRGPFRAVRHPVYSSLMLLVIARFLENASVATFSLCIAGIVLWVLKALAEESFLKEEEEYRQYMSSVRWRFVPYVF